MRKIWKRMWSILLVCSVLTSLFPASAANSETERVPDDGEREALVSLEREAESETDSADSGIELCALTETVSGYCGGESDGTNLTWTLTPYSVLTISGEGEMADYIHTAYGSEPPWYGYRSYIHLIAIGDEVTTIGESAFALCDKVPSVTIPDSVTSIGDNAFDWCNSLVRITMGNGVTSIGDGAFQCCTALKELTIPNSVTRIGEDAFSSCTRLESVTIPDSVTKIGESAFSLSGLTSVTLPKSIKKIEDFTFSSCSELTSVTIPNGVQTIGLGAFNSCENLTNITIPDSVTSIEGYAFEDCTSLADITIPDGVKEISLSTFDGCSSLASVEIPDSVTKIGWYAFRDCSELTDIYYSGTKEQWDLISVSSYNNALLDATVHFPAAKLIVSGWKNTSDVNVSLTALNGESSRKSGALVCAVYDTDGKCLGTAVMNLTLTANGITAKTVTIPCNASTAKTVKAFLLSENGYIPICDAAKVILQ